MDSLDLQIVKLLGADGRLSNHTIAQKLRVSEPTVRSRVKHLIESGTIRIRAEVNPDIFPEMLIAFVGIKQRGNPEESIDSIGAVPEVLLVANVTGSHDQIALVAAGSRQKLAEVMTRRLSSANIPDLVSSETSIVLFNRNMWLPAEKLIDALEEKEG
jgi:DNA-binding Lrp family transcriptional regulator